MQFHCVMLCTGTDLSLFYQSQKPQVLLGRLRVDDKVILKWMLKKEGVSLWTGFNWLRIWSNGGLY
jgi:hypothetical protein